MATKAGAAAEAFTILSQARSRAPEISDVRLFWEAFQKTLAGRRKIIVDDPAGGAKASRRIFWPDPPRLLPATSGDAKSPKP